MSPIDPATLATASPLPPSAPPYVNEDPNLAMVRQGLDEAEDEARETVAALYEERALASEDPDEALNDIDFTESEEESMAPELATMHEEFIPEDDEKR